MIAPEPNPSQPTIHLVAPPSSRSGTHKHLGRSVPCLLLSGSQSNSHAQSTDQIISIGDSSAFESALGYGLAPSAHFTPLLSRPSTIKGKLLDHLHSTSPAPSRIVCWSDELISLASSVASRFDCPAELISTKPSLITKPPHNIDTIRVFEPQDHDRWIKLRRTCQTDQTLAAVIDHDQPSAEDRIAARSSLGIDSRTIVIGAIADAPDQVDAREFAFLLGLLAVSGYSLLGIIPKAANQLNQALRHHRGLGQPFRILTTTDPLPQLLPLLDAYIHPTDEISGSTLLINRLLQGAGIPLLNLRHSGKAGFSRAQGSAGQLLDDMDQIVNSMQSQLAMEHS